MLWKCAAMARQIMVHTRTATEESEDLSVRSFAVSNQGYSPYTHTRTMLNTGGMGGKRRKARKRRLEGAAAGVRAERDREWVLDRLCDLVFEGMAGARQGKGERARGQSAMRNGDQPRG